MRKSKLTLSDWVTEHYGRTLSKEKLNFLRSFLNCQSPQVISGTILRCRCGRTLLIIASPRGYNPKGTFCPVCAFEDLAWPE